VAAAAKVLCEGTVFRETALIFLTVGNWHKGFDRLTQAVDNMIEQGIIKDKIIAQIGPGLYKPRHYEYAEFISSQQFTQNLSQCCLVISHAGIGTISQALEISKTIIVVPRKPELGEISNDHQFTTARQLEKEGKVLAAYEIEQLGEKLKQAESFKPNINSQQCQIFETVEKFLADLEQKKRK
jgi:UDP-N-acetylglucosamine transferase subunit ALG13